jgi:hypothetical protein
MLEDKKLSICVVWMMIGLFLVNSMNVLGNFIGVTSATMSYINKIIIFVLLLFSAKTVINRLSNIHYHIVLICTLVIISNFIFFEENSNVFKQTCSTFVFTILPILVTFVSIKDYSIVYKYILNGSYIISFLSIIVLILSFSHKNQNESYTMGYSNAMIFPLLITFRELYMKPNIKKIVVFASAILSMLILGSRGAVLAIIVYIIITIIRNLDSKAIARKNLLIWFLMLILLLAYKHILLFIVNYLSYLGVNSRTLNLFTSQSSDGVYLSGRKEIYQVIWNAIKDKPFSIRGINAEYTLVNVYSHNIILELLYQMGVVFGSIFIIYIFICILNTLKLKESTPTNELVVLSMCASLPKLFVSGTLWTQVYFWVWICLLYVAKRTIIEEYNLRQERNEEIK